MAMKAPLETSPPAAAPLRRREAFRPRKLRWPNALRRDEAASHGLAGTAGRETDIVTAIANNCLRLEKQRAPSLEDNPAKSERVACG